jgi:thioredoxin-related protein
MKKYITLAFALLALTPALMAADKKKKKAPEAKAEIAVDSTAIHWMSLDDVQVAMNKEPRKVIIDVYTDWCGWCKVMDKKTFSNTEVIKYINKNYYAVKFNSEAKQAIHFKGKTYETPTGADRQPNQFAVELLKGQMSYPTTVILEEGFTNPQAIPGYLDIPTIERMLKYLGDNHYKTSSFEDFSKTFTPVWGAASPVQDSDFRGGH